MVLKPPINLQAWIDAHRSQLKPPVGNQLVFTDNEQFMVMVVGGPNARKDFHINSSEELFYQLEGDIELQIMLNGQRQSLKISQGDIFILPPGVPHSPRRGPNTIGLVVEQYRKPQIKDGFQWFCENCDQLLHEIYIPVSDIVGQLPTVMEAFFADESLTTCKNCGTVMKKP